MPLWTVDILEHAWHFSEISSDPKQEKWLNDLITDLGYDRHFFMNLGRPQIMENSLPGFQLAPITELKRQAPQDLHAQPTKWSLIGSTQASGTHQGNREKLMITAVSSGTGSNTSNEGGSESSTSNSCRVQNSSRVTVPGRRRGVPHQQAYLG